MPLRSSDPVLRLVTLLARVDRNRLTMWPAKPDESSGRGLA
jgi:hypothetical protein